MHDPSEIKESFSRLLETFINSDLEYRLTWLYYGELVTFINYFDDILTDEYILNTLNNLEIKREYSNNVEMVLEKIVDRQLYNKA